MKNFSQNLKLSYYNPVFGCCQMMQIIFPIYAVFLCKSMQIIFPIYAVFYELLTIRSTGGALHASLDYCLSAYFCLLNSAKRFCNKLASV